MYVAIPIVAVSQLISSNVGIFSVTSLLISRFILQMRGECFAPSSEWSVSSPAYGNGEMINMTVFAEMGRSVVFARPAADDYDDDRDSEVGDEWCQ